MIDQTNNVNDERREYFRIDDSVKLSYREVEKEELPADLEELEYKASGGLTVMSRLNSISQQLSTALHRIEQNSPDVADYLKSLDQKLELLAQAFLSKENELIEQTDQPVNLSAGGMAVESPRPIGVGAWLEIKMLLFPSYAGILTYGEVVSCDSVENGYCIRVDFSYIRDGDRDALIRHILRRQGEFLRRRREEKEQEQEK